MATIFKHDFESAAISVPEGEPAVVLIGGYLMSVENLQVNHPDRQDDFCSIYGQIFISNTKNAPEHQVTLYNRSRDDAETLDIGDHHHNFLRLNFDDSAARPIVSYLPVFLTMKLFEINPDSDDTPIADLVDWEFDEFFDRDSRTRIRVMLRGESGFSFTMAYAMTAPGHWAEVEVKIIGDIYGDTTDPEANKKRKQPPIDMYGLIQASQLMAVKGGTNPSLRLYFRGSIEPVHVDVGSTFNLDRKAVVVPIGRGGAFSVDYAFNCPVTKQLIVQGSIPFYFKTSRDLDFVVNKNLTHTKEDVNGLFSVSVKFTPPLAKSPIPLEEYSH